MMRTVGDWAQQAATLPAALVEATPRAVRTSGEVLEAAARVNVLKATGGDMRLSGARSITDRRTGKNGVGKLITLAVELKGTGSRTRALVVPRGPIMLIEDRTRRHREPFRYGTGRRYAMAGERMANGGTARRRRAARAGALNIPGVGWRMFANHPGTRGKRPIRNAFTSSSSQAGRAGLLVFATAARNHL